MLNNVVPTAGLPPATAIVRNLLAQYGPLHTIQLYRLGLQHFPSETVRNPAPEAPKAVISPDGQTKFLKVSNKRGGSRLFVPMPEAPHPDHPFMSVSYMKSTILNGLEGQALIRKVRVEVPITDMSSPEALEAVAIANKINRRRQRGAAMKLPTVGSHFRKRGSEYHQWEEKVYNLDVEMVEPKYTKTEYVWELVGPSSIKGKEREEVDQDSTSESIPARSMEEMSGMAGPGSTHASMIDHPLVKSRWAIADSKEEASRRLMQMNIDRVLARKAARKVNFEKRAEQKEWAQSRDGLTPAERHKLYRQREEASALAERKATQDRFASLRSRASWGTRASATA